MSQQAHDLVREFQNRSLNDRLTAAGTGLPALWVP